LGLTSVRCTAEFVVSQTLTFGRQVMVMEIAYLVCSDSMLFTFAKNKMHSASTMLQQSTLLQQQFALAQKMIGNVILALNATTIICVNLQALLQATHPSIALLGCHITSL